MIKANLILIFVVLFSFSALNAQKVAKLLINKKWSAYDGFAQMDFRADGKVHIEYAYCSYCQANAETLDWSLDDKKLILGKDTLLIKSASKSSISTFQYGLPFVFKSADKIKPTNLNKEDIRAHLLTNTPLSLTVASEKFDNAGSKPIQFSPNGKMWMNMPKYGGQWALKSFYGNVFLVYINRFSVNRDFPLIKVQSLKGGKLIGQPIPSITRGCPFVLEIMDESF